MPDTPRESPKPVRIPCAECGGGYRQHEVIATHEEDLGSEDYRAWGTYQICKCRGCDGVRFRQVTVTEDDYDYSTGEMNERVQVYPEQITQRRDAIDVQHLPESIGRIYRETILALNAGAALLTAGGLRATVEGICLDRKVTGGTLINKIDSLVSSGLLAKPQADLLHEERFLGNTALHELLPPSSSDLTAGLDIIETLLKAIYVLPRKAMEMRARRTKDTESDQAKE